MIINLTPHTINLYEDGKLAAEFISCGVARATCTVQEAGELESFRLVRNSYGQPDNLPDYKEGTYYIVSSLTAQAAKASGRRTDDLLLTADAVRDDAGRIVGCRAFALFE